MNVNDVKLGIIGLGYVGLPLAVEFGKLAPVIGFDNNHNRIAELKQSKDLTGEVDLNDLADARYLSFSSEVQDLNDCNFYIVSVPTPVNKSNTPNLQPLIKACELIASFLHSGKTIVFESTVFPGCTEEECVPVLERISGGKLNVDFFVGYSPERINPGDKNHRLIDIVKITSGSTPEVAEFVDKVYRKIIKAGTHKAPSIKVAEAAKVIENTQRDVNIALINELSLIFEKMSIDTEDVLKAAGTKWNFLPFRPGLVGGHCIGVDPYYLTHKAQEVGYHPEIILAGRRLNDSMGEICSSRLVKKMARTGISIQGASILILGFTFKENCPDIRGTKVVDIYNELQQYGCKVDISDPVANENEIFLEHGLKIVSPNKKHFYDAIVVAVAHSQFIELGAEKIRELGKAKHVLFDMKYIFNSSESDLRM